MMFRNNNKDSSSTLYPPPSMERTSTQSRTPTAFDDDSNMNHMDDEDDMNQKSSKEDKHHHRSFSPTNTYSSNNNINHDNSNNNSPSSTQQDEKQSSRSSLLYAKFRKMIQKQLACNDNRYALQMGVAFLVATSFVVVEPISNFAPNAFWVGVSVVTVLDNSVGGGLSLSMQRMIGTFIGGGLSIVVMTISRAIFPVWSPGATVFLCFLMFCQVFTIARIKLKPNMNYAGGIGLLTTVIILLSGYPNLIHDKISGCAELGFWRVFDLIIGIIIAMWASLCIFPLKARNTMRKNLGEALQEAADLYERAAIYCLDLSHTEDISKLPLNVPIERRKRKSSSTTTTVNHHPLADKQDLENNGEKKEFQNITKMSNLDSPASQPPRQTTIQIEEPSNRPVLMSTALNRDMEIWNHELVNELCDKAFKVLSRLQTEATRLRSVSKEYYLQVPFHYLFSCGGREKCRKDLRRTKQYSNSIDAMKRIVWPLVSFRLLLPLIKHNHGQQHQEVSLADIGHYPIHDVTKNDMSNTMDNESINSNFHDRITPTQALLENFEDSLWVMRKLATMLKDTKRKLSDEPDWPILRWRVLNGTSLVQQELLEIMNISQNSDSVDGLKLLSYYGFLVRCSTIWQGLESIVNELGPQSQRTQSVSTFSHVSYPPSSQGTLHAQE